MFGFQIGGYEAAKKALEVEYQNTLRGLLDKLNQISPSQTTDREQLNTEIARCKEARI